MKHALITTLFLFLVAPFAVAQTTVEARVEVTFDADPRNPEDTVEYFVEQKTSAGSTATWSEVAKGAGSPILYTLPAVRIGDTITARVRARLIADPAVVTEPSNETSAKVPPRKPSNARSKASEPVAITLKPGQKILIAATP